MGTHKSQCPVSAVGCRSAVTYWAAPLLSVSESMHDSGSKAVIPKTADMKHMGGAISFIVAGYDLCLVTPATYLPPRARPMMSRVPGSHRAGRPLKLPVGRLPGGRGGGLPCVDRQSASKVLAALGRS